MPFVMTRCYSFVFSLSLSLIMGPPTLSLKFKSQRWKQKLKIYKDPELAEEGLLHNIVDKEFQQILYPCFIAHSILGSIEFNLINNQITTNGKLTIILNVTVVCIFVLIGILSDINARKSDFIDQFIAIFDYLYNIFGSIFLVTFSLLMSQSHVQVILKNHEMYTFFKMRYSFRTVIVKNWLYLLGLIICLMIFQIWFAVFIDMDVKRIVFDLYFMNNDISMINAICMIKLLTRYGEMWIEEMKRCRTNGPSDVSFHNMFEVYKILMDSYKLFQQIFQGVVISAFMIAANFYRF